MIVFGKTLLRCVNRERVWIHGGECMTAVKVNLEEEKIMKLCIYS